MPLREDEWGRRSKNDLRFCAICQRYMPPVVWAEHEHNPEITPPDAGVLRELEDLTSDIVYLGPVKVVNCAGVVVVQGVEIFRLRDRQPDGTVRVDLELRGERDVKLAVMKDNVPVYVAPGHEVVASDGACAVVETARRQKVASIESVGLRTVRLWGTFWVDGLRVAMTEAALELGATVIPPLEVRGRGTAIVLKKNSAAIGFAKR